MHSSRSDRDISPWNIYRAIQAGAIRLLRLDRLDSRPDWMHSTDTTDRDVTHVPSSLTYNF